jgi:hypothetical protein
VSVAGDFVPFVKFGPREVDQVLALADIEADSQRAEGDFTVTVGSDRYHRQLHQIEMAAIP